LQLRNHLIAAFAKKPNVFVCERIRKPLASPVNLDVLVVARKLGSVNFVDEHNSFSVRLAGEWKSVNFAGH
jgi:hypothetical protein